MLVKSSLAGHPSSPVQQVRKIDLLNSNDDKMTSVVDSLRGTETLKRFTNSILIHREKEVERSQPVSLFFVPR
jgi:hypothetical protein